MDVDGEVEGQLLQQFSSMGTTDKEVLITEFQKLIGDDLNPSLCAFFLDMNNWNLPAAIGSYYDYEQPSNTSSRVPVMSFVKDVTIGEGESVPTNTHFVKTWRIQNTGSDGWPPGCCLRFVQGERMGTCERVMVEALQPSAVTDVSVEMVSPGATGIFQGQWRMQTPTGMYFGEVIWVILQVEEHGLLGVTQQMSNITSSDFSHCQARNLENPFGSPNKTNIGVADNPFGSPTMGHNPFISPSQSDVPGAAASRDIFGSPDKASSVCDSGRNIPRHVFDSGCTAQNGGVGAVGVGAVDAVGGVCRQRGDNMASAPITMPACSGGLTDGLQIATGFVHNIPQTLSNSWPGTPTLTAHDVSAPTPNVSPRMGEQTDEQTSAHGMDTVDYMT